MSTLCMDIALELMKKRREARLAAEEEQKVSASVESDVVSVEPDVEDEVPIP